MFHVLTAMKFKFERISESMLKLGFVAVAVAFTIGLAGCTAKLIVQSDPPQAEVSVRVEGRKEQVKLGQTPLEITERDLMAKLNLSPDAVQWISLSLEKAQYSSREVLLPSSRWGGGARFIKLALEPSTEKMTTVSEILAHFFNAKKYADIRQFEQAHAELEKVLAIDNKSVNALNMNAGIFFLQGNLDEAKRIYREALAIDPKSSDAIKMLEKIGNREASK